MHVSMALNIGSRQVSCQTFFPARLQAKCSGQHVHKPWTITRFELGKWEFDTAKAAGYILQMCQAISVPSWMFSKTFPVFFWKILLNIMLRKWPPNFNLVGQGALCWWLNSSIKCHLNALWKTVHRKQ